MTIVGIFLNNQVRTGGHRRYLELLEGLAERGNRVVAALNAELDYEARHFEAIRVPVRYRRGQAYPIALAFKAAARRSLEAVRAAAPEADFVLVHGETHLPAAAFLKRRLGCRLCFGHRSNAVREAEISFKEHRGRPAAQAAALLEGWKYRLHERSAARAADLLAFQSGYDRDDVASRVPSILDKSVVIGGNVGAPRFRPENEGINRSEALRSIVFVGTLGTRKGLRYLLEALAILKGRGLEPPRLEVLGSGDALPEHRAFLESRGLADRVEFRGRVPDPFPYLAAADLMVVPSIFDSYPDTVLEALHAGLPVIASAVGGIPDMLGSPELLFPPQDAAEIADRIEACVRDDARYRSLRALCAERLRLFHFDWYEAWEKAMRGAIAGGGAAGGRGSASRGRRGERSGR